MNARSRLLAALSPVLALALPLAACQPGGEGTATDLEAAIAAIDSATIIAHVAELGDDRYGGRGPGSEGDRMTQEYLVAQLDELGFGPAFGDSYLQPFPIVGITANMPPSWGFSAGDRSLSLAFSTEYMAGSGVQDDRVEIAPTELVFCGYGIVAPEEDWDDYAGADVAGKVVVVLNNDPDWDPERFGGTKRLYYGRWTYKYEEAARQGAVGCVIIHTTPSAGYPWQVVQTSWAGEQFELPAGDEPRLKMPAWVTEESAYELFELGGHDLDELRAAAREDDFTPVPLGVTTSISFTVDVSRTETANVAGVLQGSDPEASRELVVYTAHHDHLGIGTPDAQGDSLYNGALDNAAGTAQVLAIAKAFSQLDPAPARSVMALFVAAEEQGLLGSRWFARHPSVHPGYLAANINIDGGNIFGPTADIAVIGGGKSDLEQLLEDAAAEQGRQVVPEPFPDKGYYYRSDQLNFARIGVPALYTKAGTTYRGRPDGWGTQKLEEWTSTKYHQPSDELDDSWRLGGMVEDARLLFRVGHAVATNPGLPAWVPGDEFEAARRDALAERPAN